MSQDGHATPVSAATARPARARARATRACGSVPNVPPVGVSKTHRPELVSYKRKPGAKYELRLPISTLKRTPAKTMR